MTIEKRRFVITIPRLDPDSHQIVEAETAGKAKYKEWLLARDAFQWLQITDMRARVAEKKPRCRKEELRCNHSHG